MINAKEANERARMNWYEIDRHAKAIVEIEKRIDKKIDEASYYGHTEAWFGFSSSQYGVDVWFKASDVREVLDRYRAAGYTIKNESYGRNGSFIAEATIEWS